MTPPRYPFEGAFGNILNPGRNKHVTYRLGFIVGDTREEAPISHTTGLSSTAATRGVLNRGLTLPRFLGSQQKTSSCAVASTVFSLSLQGPRFSSHLPLVPPTLQARDLFPKPELDCNRLIPYSIFFTIISTLRTSVDRTLPTSPCSSRLLAI